MSQPSVVSPSQPVIVIESGSSPLLLRVLYFLVLGWWLGLIVTGIAWLCILSVLLLPVGLWLMNRLPVLITLRAQNQGFHMEDGVLVRGKRQRGFLGRALYFLLVGWWFSGVWLAMAYLAVISLIGIPLAFWMYGRAGAVTTLYRS
jgi:uncharacterized membrane protein YccF (DUF307 family)